MILHGSSRPTYKCRFILTRHNAFNSDKLSSVTVDGSFTAIYSRRSVWPLECLSVCLNKNETILNSVCPSKLPQSATTLEHQYWGFPVGRVARHAVQEIRSDQVTCLYTALWITINYTVASTILLSNSIPSQLILQRKLQFKFAVKERANSIKLCVFGNWIMIAITLHLMCLLRVSPRLITDERFNKNGSI